MIIDEQWFLDEEYFSLVIKLHQEKGLRLRSFSHYHNLDTTDVLAFVAEGQDDYLMVFDSFDKKVLYEGTDYEVVKSFKR